MQSVNDNLIFMDQLEVFFADAAQIVDSALDRYVPAESVEPTRLHSAMRWSLFGGGKRFRPALMIAVGRQFGAADEQLATTAAAIEMIHTYSLIHDDLPAMDNDDLRRGHATCHKKFDEATAILAGDALQALAFNIVANDESLPVDIRLKLVQGLSNAAGRMVAGQQMDLAAEGEDHSIDQIEDIHRNKTGALIRFSAEAGAIVGGANESEIQMISEYGAHLGLLFQIVDDLLDVTQTSDVLGKTAGKDLAAEKATYPGIYGVEESKRQAGKVCAEAIKCLEKIGRSAGPLREIAEFILTRRA